MLNFSGLTCIVFSFKVFLKVGLLFHFRKIRHKVVTHQLVVTLGNLKIGACLIVGVQVTVQLKPTIRPCL
jgi:hypothetical protein